MKCLQDACTSFDGDTEKATEFCMPKVRRLTAHEFYQALIMIKKMKPAYLRDIQDDVLQEQ